ncbi:stage III sporulation protein AE [Hominifimenecus sp. rT4P-3]|uniref:stage III sporulation protein AE n=1 Tax=Hominifimenecus sp. rT4P-3 TaxID=3242979 RepID=UPI003DA6C6D8
MKRFILLAILLFLLIFVSVPVYGAGTEPEDYDLSQIEAYLEQEMGAESSSFGDMLDRVLEGDFSGALSQMGILAKQAAFSELASNKNAVRQAILIALFGSLLTYFAGAFSENSVGETGFYVSYLLLAALLFSAFGASLSICTRVLQVLLSFLSLLVPVFFMAVAYAGGTITSLGFYELTLLAIGGVQWLFLTFLVPIIEIYVTLLLVNSLSREDFLSKLTDLMKVVVDWGTKSLLGLIIGLNLVQGLVLPLVDSVKSSAVRKAVSAIPWIGNGADAVGQVLLGSGALIKNGIGTAALIFLVILCLMPLLKLGVITLMYQGAAAIVQPAADKRIVACISAVASGTKMLLKLVLYTLILFMVTVAIVCAASNANYYAG